MSNVHLRSGMPKSILLCVPMYHKENEEYTNNKAETTLGTTQIINHLSWPVRIRTD